MLVEQLIDRDKDEYKAVVHGGSKRSVASFGLALYSFYFISVQHCTVSVSLVVSFLWVLGHSWFVQTRLLS